jgi:hypothetical protein
MRTRALERRLRAKLQTDEGMASFLDRLVGPNHWTYDADEDVWVTPDTQHVGPGRGFVVVQRGGAWFRAVLPDAEATH